MLLLPKLRNIFWPKLPAEIWLIIWDYYYEEWLQDYSQSLKLCYKICRISLLSSNLSDGIRVHNKYETMLNNIRKITSKYGHPPNNIFCVCKHTIEVKGEQVHFYNDCLYFDIKKYLHCLMDPSHIEERDP